MRTQIARSLRKLADLFDPKVSPSDEISIRITCDTSDLEAGLKRACAAAGQLADRA